jgi:hypothetical protein
VHHLFPANAKKGNIFPAIKSYNCFCLVKNADFLNEFFCENYFCLYLECIFCSHFLDSVISLIYVQAKKEMRNVEGSARTESKGG